MSTSCKIIKGYVDHCGYWRETEAFQRYQDSYPEAMIPLLKEHKTNILSINKYVEARGHKIEELPYSNDGFTGVDYIYYIDSSNHNHICCTVLGIDWKFYEMYGQDNYKVVAELVL